MRSFGAVAVAASWLAFAGCGGQSNGTAGSNGAAGSNGGASPPSACDRYRTAQTLTDACAALGGCPQTLRGYLATGHVAPQNYARVGCGLTEIRDVDSGAVTSNTYVFDGTGALVGLDRSVSSSDDAGPCGTGEYSFGTLIDACDAVRECHIPKDAADTGDVCGCDCPDPPPASGVFATTPDCVYPANPISDCEPALSGELAHYGDAGLTLRSGCGFVVTGDASSVQCSYDDTGTLAGAYRADPASTLCGGVTGLQTGQPYVYCHAETSCRWGPSDPNDPTQANLLPCGSTPPAAGGSVACRAWQNETDVVSSCSLVRDCPADQQSYLATFVDLTTVLATIGCGVTWYTPNFGALGGTAYAFDASGALVGYDFWGDLPFGPCADEEFNEYKLGGDLSKCDVVESCNLRADGTPSCR
ncbi:MAG TPA: hypothetical protein VMI54_12055 [Polyangiaceae bacterium]|nr:hypothetical protein [Polyangiaceae bacterium]